MIPTLHPDWPAPDSVHAFTTTRVGGASKPPFDSLNLGLNCGDEPAAVAGNRRLLESLLPSAPGWIRQVHGKQVVQREVMDGEVEADALVCSTRELACTILTADCLPVLFCNRVGTEVAAAHAGWRGLAGGVLEATVAAMTSEPAQLMAWLGPGISTRAYVVGAELQDRVLQHYPAATGVFQRRGEQLHADLYGLARHILAGIGLLDVTGGEFCTYTEEKRFFSHRRDGSTGRMATAIWLA